ncbi:unnamed protein product, partial [Mesorhabditis belari]|uniref:Lipocalin/cytosolic fatty-acid binding domain-containing protein n=1 Tax=Mesorhabditis belari TaxID=2138241 RepID=A0AAF3FKS4_9BILA
MADKLAKEFAGSWNFVSGENFEEYMKECGVGLITRKLAANLKPVLEFVIEDGKWTMTSTSTFKTHVVKFEIGAEFNDKTADGRDVKSTFFVEGDKLIQQEIGLKGGKDSRFERYIEDGKLKIVCECNGVKSTRIYERA